MDPQTIKIASRGARRPGAGAGRRRSPPETGRWPGASASRATGPRRSSPRRDLQAETIRKEADLAGQGRGAPPSRGHRREVEDARKGFREQEKRLEKRADLLDQKLDLINKKEREFESVQRYLAEQQEEVNRRSAEVKELLVRAARRPPPALRALREEAQAELLLAGSRTS